MKSNTPSEAPATAPTDVPRGRDRTRAFSPVRDRLRGVGKTLFARRAPKVDESPASTISVPGAPMDVEVRGVVMSSEGGRTDERLSSDSGAAREGSERGLTDQLERKEGLPVADEVEKDPQAPTDGCSIEPPSVDASPPVPLALPLTPTSLAPPPSPLELFTPYQISLQIKTMLQTFLPPAVDTNGLTDSPPMDQTALLALLGRSEVMNGAEGNSEDEPASVWRYLESMTGGDSLNSIMVSCDLDLDGISDVTLASWKDFGDAVVEDASSLVTATSGWGMWPWGRKSAPVDEKPVPGGGKVVRVWYPSQKQMSLHATWWGFSIYLPHVVVVLLSGSQVDTVKRITAITTGLSYLIKFLPAVIDLGPGMLVALALLSSLLPVISFLASSIAWSWGRIQAYDKGQGVILSATWLCPLLLIARSWDAPSPLPIDIGVVPVQPFLIATDPAQDVPASIIEEASTIA